MRPARPALAIAALAAFAAARWADVRATAERCLGPVRALSVTDPTIRAVTVGAAATAPWSVTRVAGGFRATSGDLVYACSDDDVPLVTAVSPAAQALTPEHAVQER